MVGSCCDGHLLPGAVSYILEHGREVFHSFNQFIVYCFVVFKEDDPETHNGTDNGLGKKR